MTAAFRLSAFGEGENMEWQSLHQYASWGSITWKENCYFNSLLLLKIGVPIDSSKQGTGLAMPNLETTEVPKSEH